MTDADREWLHLWRIFTELGGPKPPVDVLARHQGEQVVEPPTEAGDALRARRANERAMIAKRLLMLAVATGRSDVAHRLREAIKGLGLAAKQGARRGPRYRVWRAPEAA